MNQPQSSQPPAYDDLTCAFIADFVGFLAEAQEQEFSPYRASLINGAHLADMMVGTLRLPPEDAEKGFDLFQDMLGVALSQKSLAEAVVLTLASCLGRADSQLRQAVGMQERVRAEMPDLFAEVETWVERFGGGDE